MTYAQSDCSRQISGIVTGVGMRLLPHLSAAGLQNCRVDAVLAVNSNQHLHVNQQNLKWHHADGDQHTSHVHPSYTM